MNGKWIMWICVILYLKVLVLLHKSTIYFERLFIIPPTFLVKICLKISCQISSLLLLDRPNLGFRSHLISLKKWKRKIFMSTARISTCFQLSISHSQIQGSSMRLTTHRMQSSIMIDILTGRRKSLIIWRILSIL